jgi:hypothetical protein
LLPDTEFDDPPLVITGLFPLHARLPLMVLPPTLGLVCAGAGPEPLLPVMLTPPAILLPTSASPAVFDPKVTPELNALPLQPSSAGSPSSRNPSFPSILTLPPNVPAPGRTRPSCPWPTPAGRPRRATTFCRCRGPRRPTVTVEIDAQSDPISGHVINAGRRHPFSGWLELAAALPLALETSDTDDVRAAGRARAGSR